jgi:hypothetical protein
MEENELKSTDIKTENEDIALGTQFLLADFNLIRGFKEQIINIVDKRIDVFLKFTSVVIAGLGILSQLGLDNQNYILIILISSFFVMMIGIITFQQVIEGDILVIDYVRAINRIRSYFVDKAPHTKPYFLMPTSHHFPKYKWQSSQRRLPMLINSLSLGTFVTTNYLLIWQTKFPDFFSVLLSVNFLLLTYVLQAIYANRSFNQAEVKAQEGRTVTLFESENKQDNHIRI